MLNRCRSERCRSETAKQKSFATSQNIPAIGPQSVPTTSSQHPPRNGMYVLEIPAFACLRFQREQCNSLYG